MTRQRQDRLESKLDTLISDIGTVKVDVAVIKESHRNAEVDREATQKSVEALSGRVLSLEKFKYKIVGYASAAGTVLAIGGDWIKHKLTGS